MTQQEIIEGNKSIAVFMGSTIRKGKKVEVVMNEDDPKSPYVVERVSHLKYHESWDWLIPVVEKIEALEDFDEFRIETNQVVVKAMGFYKIIQFGEVFHAEFKTKIETVWSGCSQFIKWYNEQSNNPHLLTKQ